LVDTVTGWGSVLALTEISFCPTTSRPVFGANPASFGMSMEVATEA
jgi:hypothetical protein